MGWNQGTRIALYSVLEMARSTGQPVTAKAVANKYAMSVHHVSKVLSQLAKSGIVTAVRGAGGGHRLALEPERTTLLDVVEAIEGPGTNACPLATEQGCLGPANCGLGAILRQIDQQTLDTLEAFTLADAARSAVVRDRLTIH